jgi:hypothetical protein
MNIGDFELIEPVPEMSNTIAIGMLRPWIDVGRVGTVALGKLQENLGAKELAYLEKPGKYFDYTRYRPRARVENGRRILKKPNTNVYHALDKNSGRNYIFIHIREPHSNGEEYVESILKLFEYCNVTEYCRVGGMYDSVPHTRPILVTGSMTKEQEGLAGSLLNPRKSTYQGPTSILNLVNQELTKNKINNSTLMAHLPQYVQLDRDHLGATRILEVLCAVYGFSTTVIDRDVGIQQYKDIDKSINYSSEVGTLIKQLETYYDRVLAKGKNPTDEMSIDSLSASSVNFSPDVEDFLNEMGERFEKFDDLED